MTDFSSIKDAIINGIVNLFGDNNYNNLIVIEETKKEFRGDLTLVCFPLLKWSKTSPEKTANILGQHLLEKEDFFDDFNVVKGFLNLSVKTSYWLTFFKTWFEDSQFGLAKESSGKLYMVEYLLQTQINLFI